MEARDLRIGNLVEMGSEGISLVSGYNLYQLTVKENGSAVADYYHNWKPIPLTEDWLAKFGFEDWGVVEINEYESYRRFVAYNVLDGTGNFEVHFITSTYGGRTSTQWVFSEDKDETINVKESEYVHNLQNVFYLYAGFELELKTEVNQ